MMKCFEVQILRRAGQAQESVAALLEGSRRRALETIVALGVPPRTSSAASRTRA
jgi:hypothetical protein